MSRKHFQALADALKRSKPVQPKDSMVASECNTYYDALAQWKDDVRAVASVCNEFNDRFDRDTFYTAAGKED